MKKYLLLLFIFYIGALSFSQSDKRLKGIEKQFNSVLKSTKAPGFAVAIVEGDKIIYSKGFGYSDVENKVLVDGNTLFAIGSSTKAFTSALLGILRKEEKLSFDDRPRKYIPELEFYNDDMNTEITIKDLMQHSTGLPRHDGAWYFFPSHDKDSLVARLKHHEPFTGVRDKWYYNNFGFLTQGIITERITGQSWETNIKDKFFEPLGMSRSKTTINGLKESRNIAVGYELDNDRHVIKMKYYDIAGMSPAGSINSSVNDMSKWLMTWINDGKFNGKQIIPVDYMQEAIRSQMIVASGFPSEELPNVQFANYGYGWFLHSYKGHYMVEHGGNIDGFSANVAFYPTDNLGIVVLANQNGSVVPNLIRNIAADYMLNVEKTDWAKQHKNDLEKALKAQSKIEEDAEISNVKNTTPSHTKLGYTGSYKNKGYGKFNIVLENDSLYTKLNENRLYLNHFHYDTFELIEVKNGKIDTSAIGKSLKISFNTNLAGDIDKAEVAIEPMVDAIEFKRTTNTIDVDEKTLKAYVGKYNLAGTEIKTYIKDNNVLYIFLKGQPEYALIPTAIHKFNFKALEGFKVEFVEGENGKIEEVKFIQPNGIFIAKRKTED